jgi:hypothetical protein
MSIATSAEETMVGPAVAVGVRLPAGAYRLRAGSGDDEIYIDSAAGARNPN